MTSSIRSTSPVVTATLGLLALGCLGPNPLIDAGESETSGDGDGDGDGDPSGDGDGDGDPSGDGDGDGDGDSSGDGDGEPDTCSNLILDGDETDVDCGGSCSPCDDGLGCLAPGDCVSMICTEDSCQAPSCDDDVHNGDELGIDCGGACTFCEHGEFETELDNYEGSAAHLPHVDMFTDGSFALTYRGPMEAKLRWFDEFGLPEGTHVELSDEIEFNGPGPIHLVVDPDPAEHLIHAVEVGHDMDSQGTDIFLLRRGLDEQLNKARVNDIDHIATQADIAFDGDRATVVWMEDGQPYLRRYDYDLGGGNWSDVSPFEAETEPDTNATVPVIAQNAEGLVAIAWVRCTTMGPPCDVVARRFDNGWLDPAPVVLSTDAPAAFFTPQIALADDGRAMALWYRLDLGSSDLQARMLDANFDPEGEPWTLQAGLPSADFSGVAALSDGSFAAAWADRDVGRIHLSRFIGPDTLRDPELPDEAPWANLGLPNAVAIAAIDRRLVVVWAATVDMVSQIQGQVLSY